MPRRCLVLPALDAHVAAQDGVLTREQGLAHGLTPRAIAYRLACGAWQGVLPGVYVTHSGVPTRRQRLVAALLFAGPTAAIDAVDACHFHGVSAVRPDESLVHVVVPWGDTARTRGFVVV